MSGSRPKPAEAHLAEQHLGDRLSALVDGELGHESRERVLAHLATCARCKAEADAQRRLKNVFAEAAPPPPSESFLARLQGLPGGGDLDGGGTPPAGPFGGRGSDAGVYGVRRGERFEFGYVPARPHTASAAADEQRGFRIHPVGRPDLDRSSWRGLRFAFAAAGAVSLAAIALGGVSTGIPGAAADATGGSGTGSVVPARSTGAGGTAPQAQRRRQAGPLLAQSTPLGQAPAVPTSMSAPLLPGVTPPAAPALESGRGLATPVVTGLAAVSPLIRPLNDAEPLNLVSWPKAPKVAPAPEVPSHGLLSAPAPGVVSLLSPPSATPTPSVSVSGQTP